MDALISDWSKNNPYLSGPNWKCGQEASLRLINLIVLIKLLIQKKLQKSDASLSINTWNEYNHLFSIQKLKIIIMD